MTAPDNTDSYVLAASLASRWISAYHAGDEQAGPMMRALQANPYGLALAFGAIAEMFIHLLTRLERDRLAQDKTLPHDETAVTAAVQVLLDRQALNLGAAGDAVVARHQGNA